MEPLEESEFTIIDSTEDYISSELPTLLLPQFTAIIGPFLASWVIYRRCTDDEAEED
jgi:hypothetical protein